MVNQINQSLLRWGALSADSDHGSVIYGTQVVSLTPEEDAILKFMLQNPQIALNSRRIRDQVGFPSDPPNIPTIRARIKKLRQKLTDLGAPQDFIQTESGVGYRLNPLYCDSSSILCPTHPSTPPPFTELNAANTVLQVTLEQLRLTQDELQQKNQELEIAYQTIEQERQQLQASRNELEMRVVERTAELIATNQSLQKIEAQLRQREEFLSSIYDGAEQSIFVIDVTDSHDFHYIGLNRSAQRFMGVNLQKIQDRTPEGIFGSELGLQFRQKCEHCLEADSSVTYENHFIWNDRPIWTITTLSPLRNPAGRIYRIVGTSIDVTDRKQAEIERYQREAFLSSIFEGAEQAIFVIDVTDTKDLRYVAFNRQSEQFAKLSQQEIQGKTPEEAFGSQIGARFRQNYERCLQAGAGICYEEYIVFENHTLWALTTLSPLRNEQGEVYRIVGTAVDISDRKRAEFRLQQQIRQESLLADIAQDIRRSLNLNEVLSRTVHRVREFLNTDRVIIFRFRPNWHGDVITESVGAEWPAILSTTIFDPCFNDRYLASYCQGRISTLSDINQKGLVPCYVELLKQFQVKANLVVPLLQGEKLWGLLIAHHCTAPRQWQSGEIELLRQLATQVSIAIQQSELYEQTRRELSERKRMQAILEESEERFRTLSAAAPIGICQTNADGICLYVNQRWQEMSGLSLEDCLGNGWLQSIHPEDREMLLSAWDACLQGEKELLPEFRLLTPQNEVRWVSAKVATIKSSTGEIIGYVSVDEDITEKKHLEAQFYRAQRLESLGTMASGIAHDLNNVLSPILAIAQLLRLQRSNVDGRAQEMLKVLEDSAKRGAKMIQQILTFARGTEGEKSPVKITPVLQEVINVVQQTFPKSIKIQQNIPDSSPWVVSADSTYLHQVFMNLCINARDAMPQGGILTFSIEDCFVDQAFAQTNLESQVGYYVVVSIADTGTGIPLEVRDRIFDPFFTTKAPGQGTGLGLATVLGIVKNYGGFLQVLSEIGCGTEMKVYLPIITGIPSNWDQGEEQFSGNGALVLVVDDDVAVQQSTQSLLESYEYEVLSSNDGLEALQLYTQYQDEIRCILLDVMMPNISGILLIQKLREINPKVRIIAMSGLPVNREPALAIGANAFLNKPYTLDTLLKKLHDLTYPFQDSKEVLKETPE